MASIHFILFTGCTHLLINILFLLIISTLVFSPIFPSATAGIANVTSSSPLESSPVNGNVTSNMAGNITSNITRTQQALSEMLNLPSVGALTGGPKPYFVPQQVGNSTVLVPKENLFLTQPTSRYILRIDSVWIGNTRSPFTDTDTVAVAVKSDNGEPITNSYFLGNVGDGEHPINLYVGPLEIRNKLEFVYAIVNRADPNEVGAQNLAINLAKTVAIGLAGETLGISLVYLALHELAGGFFPGGCDGAVAYAQIPINEDRLDILTTGGSYTQTDIQRGVESPNGCGPTSNYEVTWTIARAP